MLLLLATFAIAPIFVGMLAKAWGSRAFFVAALLPALTFAHAMTNAPVIFSGGEATETWTWIPDLNIRLSMRMDLLGWVMTLIVTGVGALVLLYCARYFENKDDEVPLFSGVLLAFAGAMYGLVLTDDIVVLVMFWELTSVLSYLLIGHYHYRASSRRAALQALLVTTMGGLVMFIGVVLMVVESGTTVLSDILAMTPSGPVVSAALVLIIVGGLSKSAIFPFHFWLPGAMAAPTPVSAYLHAAAMVKAGIYLFARFAPAFANDPVWRPIVISLGVFTMLLGGFQALRETDLKRILAFGTVSQLGLLTTVLAFGTQAAAVAGLALLIGHATFKSALFLIVGVIDRQLSTRNIAGLSGLARQAPVMTVFSVIAVACMIGLPPTIGFAAKEGALTAFLTAGQGGSAWGWVGFAGIIVGSILTMAYGCRFIWGAFMTKRDAQRNPLPITPWPDPPIGFLAAPLVLATISLLAGMFSSMIDPVLQLYAKTAPLVTAGFVGNNPPESAHLALWHGFEPALFISLAAYVIGFSVFVMTRSTVTSLRVLPFTGADAYNVVMRGIDRLSVITTSLTQRGSLPVYVATIFVVLVAAEATALLAAPEWQVDLATWHNPVQLVVAPLMIVAGLIAVRARKRYTGVVLVSVTGLGMVVLFATSGAPDLALTQILVETVTLVAFALVLRRIPARMGEHHRSVAPFARGLLAATVGVTMAAATMVVTGARNVKPISTAFPELAFEGGHGRNIVNVALVDLRGWDTMGELSVLILAATGVASLVFVTDRTDLLSQLRAVPKANTRRARLRPLVETGQGVIRQTPDNKGNPRAWLIGGQMMTAETRSIMLEVIVRILFHTIIVVSVYLLFAGHNLPGGGFAGGLVAGMALVMRYVAGGRYELGAAAPTDAGIVLGSGMALAVLPTVVPLFFGMAPLESVLWEAEIPLLGHIEFVSSTLFDMGVYLVVIGLVLDVLRSLGAEVDNQANAERGVTV